MPYSGSDRLEFAGRTTRPDGRVLDLGGMLRDEIPLSLRGIGRKDVLDNAVVLKPNCLPFRDSVFCAAVSYHYPDMIPAEMLARTFEEVARVLEPGARFHFRITLWAAENESQQSNLMFDEVLKSAGALFQHDPEEIGIALSDSGFQEIAVEVIRRNIQIPQEYVRSHLIMVGRLIKNLKVSGLKSLSKRYYEQVSLYGEELVPALHFTADRI